MAIFTQSQLYNLAISVGIPSSSAVTASAIGMAESGGNSAAINPGTPSAPEYSVGLWQINLISHPQYTSSQMLDPTQNAKAMSVISNGGTSWRAWGAYNNGSYLKYMNNNVGSGGGIVVSTGNQPVTSYAPLGSGSQLETATSVFGLKGTVSTNPATTSQVGSAWIYILAYLVGILIIVFVTKFQAGYNAIYYLAVLFFMILLLTQASFIANAIKPLINTGSTQVPITA